MPKRKDDNFPVFFGGRKRLSKKEISMVAFGFFFGTIGAIMAVIIFGKDHKIPALFVMAISIIIGLILGAKVSKPRGSNLHF
jgi:uncharacterized membrane protein YfcA